MARGDGNAETQTAGRDGAKDSTGAAEAAAAAGMHLSPLDAADRLARAGKDGALTHLQSVLDKHPDVWKRYGDVAASLERGWADQIAGGEPLVRESILKASAATKAELLGPDPTPLDRLLVDRLAAAMLQQQHADWLDLALVKSGDLASPTAAFVLKRQDAAHRRTLRTARTLATVRKLGSALRIEVNHTGGPAGQGAPSAAEAPDVAGGRLRELMPTAGQ